MQVLGKGATEGFKLEDLEKAKSYFEEKGVKVEIHHLNKMLPSGKGYKVEEAYLLVARGGAVSLVKDFKGLKVEQDKLKKDTKAFMYGRVVNKKARHNLCFAEKGQESDFENGKGTVVAFDSVPILKELRSELDKALGEKAKDLVAEGNYYYDVKNCFIGYHGDGERKRVVAIRLGASFPLHYQWYLESKAIGSRFEIMLNDGDVYVMSEKAVGTDWKLKKTLTLRHAAGFPKVLGLPAVDPPKVTLLNNEEEEDLDEKGGIKRTLEGNEDDKESINQAKKKAKI
jgi:hypothetical protein